MNNNGYPCLKNYIPANTIVKTLNAAEYLESELFLNPGKSLDIIMSEMISFVNMRVMDKYIVEILCDTYEPYRKQFKVVELVENIEKDCPHAYVYPKSSFPRGVICKSDNPCKEHMSPYSITIKTDRHDKAPHYRGLGGGTYPKCTKYRYLIENLKNTTHNK